MNNIFLSSLIVLVFFTDCTKKKDLITSNDFLPREAMGKLEGKNLEEISGMAAAINNIGYLWIHNDSGNEPEVYLIDKSANLKLTVKLNGIKNRDWEDIAIGPGPMPGKSYIYIADIGDNFARHTYKYIYRFEEPELKTGIDTIEIKDVDKITFKLSDRPKDAEAILLDPKTKDLYIISKREDPARVYQLKYPYEGSGKITANFIFTLPLTQITAGCFSADGKEILLKDYEDVYYWKVRSGLTAQQVLQEKPKVLAYKPEPQGEAIAWARDGSGFYTISEKIRNEKGKLYFYKRR